MGWFYLANSSLILFSLKIKSSFDGWVAVDLPIRQGRDNQLRLLWPKIKLHENRRPPDLPLAYAMQTSGTTGDFKLVLVPHCCIVPNILHLKLVQNFKDSCL